MRRHSTARVLAILKGLPAEFGKRIDTIHLTAGYLSDRRPSGVDNPEM